FSENFLMLLSKGERAGLEFRKIERTSRARKQFFELIGPTGPRDVVPAGLEPTGWRCATCGANFFGFDYSTSRSIDRFVATADFPSPLPDVFTIGDLHDLSLCMTAARRAKTINLPGMRGITSSLIGVVPDVELVREPKLKPRLFA